MGAAAYAHDRHRGLHRPEAVLRLRPRRATRRLRDRRSARRWATSSSWPAASPAAARIQAILLGGAAGAFVGPRPAGHAAHVRGRRAPPARRSARAWSWCSTRPRTSPDALRRIAAFFRDESCGQCVPCRVGTVRQEELLARLAAGRAARARSTRSSPCSTTSPRRCATPRSAASARRRRRRSRARSRPGLVHFDGAAAERRDDPTISTASTPSRRPARRACPAAPPAARGRRRSSSRSTARRSRSPPARRSSRPPAQLGIDTPTLCYLENLTPVNVCRVCVVEVTGSRVLAPGLLAQGRARDGGPDRQRARPALAQARPRAARLVGRPVASPAPSRPDGTSPDTRALRRRRDALRPAGGARRSAGERDARAARPPPRAARRGPRAETVAQPVKVDNDLYVRDYSRCILCYKCVEACGEDAQNTFAIAVAGRGFDARISTEFDVPLPESACVYCGNCIGVCPTGALMFRSEHEHARGRHLGRPSADRHRHDLPVLRRRLHAVAPRPGQRGS